MVSTAVCAYATSGTGTSQCVAAAQAATSSAAVYGSRGSIEDSLKAGAKSGALAYSNAAVTGYVGDVTATGVVGKGLLHGARGAFFAKIAGSDVRSGFVGGLTEGMLGGYIGKHKVEIFHSVFLMILITQRCSSILKRYIKCCWRRTYLRSGLAWWPNSAGQ